MELNCKYPIILSLLLFSLASREKLSAVWLIYLIFGKSDRENQYQDTRLFVKKFKTPSHWSLVWSKVVVSG